MTALVQSLMLLAALHGVKAEMIERWPEYAQQIRQASIPSVGYRHRPWFDWRRMRFILGRCDPFLSPQILVARGSNSAVTWFRLKHEVEHFVAFAAGLPDCEHRRIDGRRAICDIAADTLLSSGRLGLAVQVASARDGDRRVRSPAFARWIQVTECALRQIAAVYCKLSNCAIRQFYDFTIHPRSIEVGRARLFELATFAAKVYEGYSHHPLATPFCNGVANSHVKAYRDGGALDLSWRRRTPGVSV